MVGLDPQGNHYWFPLIFGPLKNIDNSLFGKAIKLLAFGIPGGHVLCLVLLAHTIHETNKSKYIFLLIYHP